MGAILLFCSEFAVIFQLPSILFYLIRAWGVTLSVRVCVCVCVFVCVCCCVCASDREAGHSVPPRNTY
jgi:hypothetical protein